MDELAQALREIETARDLSAIEATVRRMAKPFGYDSFVLFSASPALDDLVEHIYWVEGDWFGDQSNVDAETYVRHCPVTRHILETDEPFFWTKTQAPSGEKYRVVSRGQDSEGIWNPRPAGTRFWTRRTGRRHQLWRPEHRLVADCAGHIGPGRHGRVPGCTAPDGPQEWSGKGISLGPRARSPAVDRCRKAASRYRGDAGVVRAHHRESSAPGARAIGGTDHRSGDPDRHPQRGDG